MAFRFVRSPRRLAGARIFLQKDCRQAAMTITIGSNNYRSIFSHRTTCLNPFKLHIIKHMPQFLFLCFEVDNILLMRVHLQRYPFHDFQAITFQPYDFPWIIRHESHLPYTEVNEYLGTNTIVSEAVPKTA